MVCVAIFGPTASGKSGLAVKIAKKMNGVILSADSMQIYRKMNIGTAKPTPAEMDSVPHRLIDICDPDEYFSVYDYKSRAEEEIKKANDAGIIPILTGGTGLYFDALFHNTNFGEFEVSDKVRQELLTRSAAGGNALLLQELMKIDPESAGPLHEKDTKRIIRALEVYYSTGKTLSELKKESRKVESPIRFCKIFLNFNSRQTLYDRINDRVEQMIKDGLLEETKSLLEGGVFRSQTASQAIGYKELLPYFEENRPLDECIELLKQKTRNYAKRQITWFRRYHDAKVLWMDQPDSDPVALAMEHITEFLKEEANESEKNTD